VKQNVICFANVACNHEGVCLRICEHAEESIQNGLLEEVQVDVSEPGEFHGAVLVLQIQVSCRVTLALPWEEASRTSRILRASVRGVYGF
jgi:hypothetical protein